MLDRGMNYLLGDKVISLDGNSQRICYVSHAHSDHTSALRCSHENKQIISSEETLALTGCSGSVERISFPGVRLLRSGHVLGSTQFLAEHDGGVFVYTGDFKLDDGLTTKGAEIPKCDYLLIEGTFGSPEMVFPEREKLWEEIGKWAKEKQEKGIVILGGYSIGKSQELIAILNKYAGITPFVHKRVAEVSSVYNQFGAKLDFLPLESGHSHDMKGNFVAVMPPNLMTGPLLSGLAKAYGKEIYTALATGWAMKGWGANSVDKMFPLSDHADFKDLLRYVEQASPRRIYCCHGNERKLASILRDKGYDALPVRDISHEYPQVTLADASA